MAPIHGPRPAEAIRIHSTPAARGFGSGRSRIGIACRERPRRQITMICSSSVMSIRSTVTVTPRTFVSNGVSGHRIEMVYLRVRSAQLAPRRVAARLRPGGHDVPRLMSLVGSQEGGETFSASTARWPTAGPCTTIRAGHQDYWRRVREGENANEGKATTELCRWSRQCLASCGKGCSEDCAHVRHAALRVGKRQGCGEEAVRPCHRQPPTMQSYIRFVGIFVGIRIR